MYNKTIIRFGFCDIQNNRGLGKGYQPQPTASTDNPYLATSTSIILDITKTSSNNCLLLYIVLTISILIGQEPPAYFENSRDSVDKLGQA